MCCLWRHPLSVRLLILWGGGGQKTLSHCCLEPSQELIEPGTSRMRSLLLVGTDGWARWAGLAAANTGRREETHRACRSSLIFPRLFNCHTQLVRDVTSGADVRASSLFCAAR